MDFINEQNKSKLLLQACLSSKSCGLTTLKNDKNYLFRLNVDNTRLVYTKTVYSVLALISLYSISEYPALFTDSYPVPPSERSQIRVCLPGLLP